ncbi:MAG: hypothetical protein JWP98_120, partial [Edaphobacter sp.]|nr:hypothetical protein [Edaphobacter sp.]
MIQKEGRPMPDADLVIALSKLLATVPGVAEERTEAHATFLT